VVQLVQSFNIWIQLNCDTYEIEPYTKLVNYGY